MQDDYDFSEVVSSALEYLKSVLNYKYVTIRHYRSRWLPVKEYMELHKIDSISASVCNAYLKSLYHGRTRKELSANEKLIEKSVSVLSEFIETGSIQQKKKLRYLSGTIGNLIKEYLVFKRSHRLSNNTIEKIESHLSNFNFWLLSNDIYKINSIGLSHIISFIQGLDPYKKALIHDTLNDLRNFFHYLYERKITTSNIASLVPKDNYNNHSKLPSYYTEAEISQLLGSIDRGNSLGKRDYAVLILAARLGLRASDIARLKFENLHWNESTISLRQYKTGKDIRLPLLPMVGNAILDYIQYGRPKSNEPFVFLLAYSPYLAIKPGTIANMVGRRFQFSGLSTKGRRHGGHALRHSLVGELITQKQTLPVIAEVLGHQNIASTKHYIRIDIESLRRCALDVPPVNPNFYAQDQNNYFFK